MAPPPNESDHVPHDWRTQTWLAPEPLTTGPESRASIIAAHRFDRTQDHVPPGSSTTYASPTL